MFTDGYRDQKSLDGRKLGSKNFRELVSDSLKIPFSDRHDFFSKYINKFIGSDSQVDDITIVNIKL